MKGKLFVVSGPSGVGKNTLLNAVIDRSENVRYSVSATSRPIRPGEVDGKSYYFVTRERFEALIADDALLEYAEYVGNYYGTPLAPIREAIASVWSIAATSRPGSWKSDWSARAGSAVRRNSMITSSSTTICKRPARRSAPLCWRKSVKPWSASI